MSIDLPLIGVTVIAVAVLLYVILDGFDLGVGILFPLARTSADRDVMMSAIAPYWDGNETWLVMGGGGLFALFPTAYAILMPAFYLPVMLMLLGLILRGVAFEFRLHGRARGKRIWTIAFAAGSIVAALAQGLVVGGFVQGVRVSHLAFAGRSWDWATPFSLLTAAGVLAGYALLGATWLLITTRDSLHGDARRWVKTSAVAVALLLGATSFATLLLHPRISARWGISLSGADFATLGPKMLIPILGAVGLTVVFVGLRRGSHALPFAGAVLMFLSGYLGLAASFFPYIVPYAVDFRQAANAPNALALVLAGVAVLLPLILAYTGFVYWLFRGKVAHGASY
ncbi:MAG TPA: cytochrome d ubiquinol oxidase subunit II [Caulobacteraceae bacterium]